MTVRVVCVGDLGRALTALSPSGLVELDGRRLDARSDGAVIPADAAVVVLRGDPTGYVVRQVSSDHPFPTLPNAGAEIARPEFMRNSAEVRVADAREAAAVRRAWAAAGGGRVLPAAAIGAAVGVVDGSLVWGYEPEVFLPGAAVGLAVGTALALLVVAAGRPLRYSVVAGIAALAGGLVGAEVGFWAHVAAGANLAAALVVGALAGTVAGGWVGRNIDVLGGPDAGA